MRTTRRTRPSRTVALAAATLALALAGPVAGAQTLRAADPAEAAGQPAAAAPAPAAPGGCGEAAARAGVAAPRCRATSCPACHTCHPLRGCVLVRCPAGSKCDPELNLCLPDRLLSDGGTPPFAPASAALLAAGP
ncbi:hypothetical protein ACIQ9E_02775 [Streptomyces sp. NPDC094448]|uniref:hypothetical protein n=1 Tax=Streptomyces sp. NPDC094448 TaxID=3366063 RepID=UPI0037FCC23E